MQDSGTTILYYTTRTSRNQKGFFPIDLQLVWKCVIRINENLLPQNAQILSLRN